MNLSSNKNIFIFIFILFANRISAQEITFFVSLQGSDLNNGSIVSPFRTLSKAKETILNHPQRLTSNFVVNLREGKYIQENTLAFTSADNIGVDKTITYQSYNNENVEITGGVSVQNWSPVAGKPYYEATITNSNFRQFYTNNKRRQRASSGIIPVTDFISSQKNGYIVKRELLPFNYSKNDAEIHVMNVWKHAIIPLDSINQQGGFSYIYSNKMKILESSIHALLGVAYTEIVGALELLDEPGEWYCDKANNKIYYYPDSDENINNLNAVIPYTEKFITLNGATPTNRIKNILFKNLKFSYSSYTLPNNNTFLTGQGSFIQLPSQGFVRGSIEINNADDLVFENCKFEHLGATAIRITSNTNRINISCNRFWDIGEAAVSIDAGDYITINNNLFYKTGAEILSACAIFATYPSYLTITNNEIRDVPYSGISVGWGWSTNPNRMRNNIIQGNRVFNYMRRLHDGGGIYTISRQDNSIINSNYLFNSYSGQGAIYLDGGSSLFTVSNNVVDGSSLYWYSAFSTNSITVNNNFTNNSNNINQTSNSTFTNTNVFTNLSTNPSALSIFNNSGNQGNCIDRSVIEVNTSTPAIVVSPLYTVNLDENLIVKPKYVNLNYNNGSQGGNYTKWTTLSSSGGQVTFESNYYGLQNVLAFTKAGSYSIKIELFNAFGLMSATTFSVNVVAAELGENIALKKPVISSSILNSNYEDVLGNDNDVNTSWRSLNATKNLFYQIDLRGYYPLSRVELISDKNMPNPSSTHNFWIQGSNESNFSKFVNLAYVNNESKDINTNFAWNFTYDGSSYRYIRLRSLRPEGFFNLSEFRVLFNPSKIISQLQNTTNATPQNTTNTTPQNTTNAVVQNPNQRIGIGTKIIDESAVLELKSDKSGFLMPRLTYNEIISIPSPARGLLVFCKDCNPKCFFEADEGKWKKQNIGTPYTPTSTPLTTASGGLTFGEGLREPYALLQLNSSNQGVLLPKLQQLEDIPSPVEGLIAYCINCNPSTNYVFNGKSWELFMVGTTDVNISTGTNQNKSLIGINNTNPDPSAALDAKAYDKGILLPRLTKLELNQISSPNLSYGLLVYCTDCEPKGLYFFDAPAWYSLLKKPATPYNVYAERSSMENSALIYFSSNEPLPSLNAVTYTATAYLNGNKVDWSSSETSPITLVNLTPGEAYTFSVSANSTMNAGKEIYAINSIVPGSEINMSNLLLDQISTPASLVYSLRKLKSAYTGPCIKVRRDSDNTELDIGFNVGGELDIFSLLQFSGTANVFVRTWYDQSGNAHHLTQTNQAMQMRIVKQGVLDANGTRVGLFSPGSNSLMTSTATGAIGLGNTDKALNAVLTKTSADMAITVGSPWGAKSSFWIISQNWATYLPFINGGEVIAQPSLSPYIPQILTIRHSNSVTQGFENSISRGWKSQIINSDNNGGIRVGLSPFNHSSLGWFFEIIYFNGDLTETNRQILEKNQIEYYRNEKN